MNDSHHGKTDQFAARLTVAARWVVPVDDSPIEHGVIEIEGGRIVSLHQDVPDRADFFEDGVIVPGLINAHTHLEFSNLQAPIEANSFANWIRAVVSHRQKRKISSAEASAIGLRECAASGATTVGEIATEECSDDSQACADLRLVVFRELLALDPSRIPSQLEIASEHLRESLTAEPRSTIRGLSPHAPYSVHPDLFHQTCDLAVERNAPIAFHLAETLEELELLDAATGRLVELFREMGFWIDGQIPAGSRPLDYLNELARVPRALVIHGNYLTDEEIRFLADESHLTVVYCPRTHNFFGHSPHPWLKMRDRGVRVALGTDSRASNPDLSLWNEVVFLRRRFPDVDPGLLLQMATQNGAEGLGIGKEAGSLTPGKAADLAVIQPAERDPSAPFAGLMESESQVIATMRNGRWTHRGPATQSPAEP